MPTTRDDVLGFISYSCERGEHSRCTAGREQEERRPKRIGEDRPIHPLCVCECKHPNTAVVTFPLQPQPSIVREPYDIYPDLAPGGGGNGHVGRH